MTEYETGEVHLASLVDSFYDLHASSIIKNQFNPKLAEKIDIVLTDISNISGISKGMTQVVLLNAKLISIRLRNQEEALIKAKTNSLYISNTKDLDYSEINDLMSFAVQRIYATPERLFLNNIS
jgi:hypothetical protein